jgi:hypothetical protein
MLTNELLPARAQESPQDDSDDKHVVELTSNRDEVGHEVEWEREVSDEPGEKQLVTAGHTRVGHQPPGQHETVRDESGERPRLGPSPRNEQDNNEDNPDQRDSDPGEREPEPPAHAVRPVRSRAAMAALSPPRQSRASS